MGTTTGGRRGLILDRDGVINEDTGYVHRIADCCFTAGVFAMTAAFAARGFAIVIATNQSGIGRGLYGEAEYTALMDWIRAEFGRNGVGIAAYRRDNPWRKPGPGMILQAAADLSLDLARSWTVGDRDSDIVAGRAAGVGRLVRYDALAPKVERCEDVWVVPRLADVTALLEAEEG